MTEKAKNHAFSPDATALGRGILIEAMDQVVHLCSCHNSPEGRAMRRVTRGVHFMERGAINTGISEFDAGFAWLMKLGHIVEG